MGRPRAFDEAEVVAAAVSLFADRAYDGISVDDLVAHLGVHRNSLYKVFGSKRGLYLAALRHHLTHQVRPLLAAVRDAPDPAQALTAMLASDDDNLNLLLLAALERAPVDPEVAGEVTETLREFDTTIDAALRGDGTPSALAPTITATLLGLRLRARTSTDHADATALLDLIHKGASHGTDPR
ncbi:TetR/AcrR family transcriptional regulator [Catenuloplanes sp. NPDC051500]|uniref:TetR/AcrR family transcriptional regulator n=1 Tax=Catenuloplanes sp. NPDC051500 TaxID=3363959 RepID=UPI003792CA5F